MNRQRWDIIVGNWTYKRRLTLQRASEIVISILQDTVNDVAIIPTGRR